MLLRRQIQPTIPMQLPEQKKASKPASQFAIRPIEEAILRAVHTYHYLTNEQIVRLKYSKGSLSHVRNLTHRLTEAGFLQRVLLPDARMGKPKSIYTLGGRGIAYLRQLGLEVVVKYRPSEEREKENNHHFLAHTLAVNDFLIAANLLPKRAPHITLYDLRHERVLRHENPPRVTIKVGDKRERTQSVAVIPDGWLDFRISDPGNTPDQACILLELDRGTESIKPWKYKVQTLLAYEKRPDTNTPSAYERQFGTTSLTIAVATTTNEKRLADLVRWTEQELEALNAKHNADLFRFSLLPQEIDPTTLFLAPSWHRPFDASL